jgi:hypothetical protein
MGTRQLRFREAGLTPAALQPYVGHVVECIGRDGTTVTGRLLSVSAAGVVVRSVNAQWYNRAKHTSRPPFVALAEVGVLAGAPY